MDKIVKKPLHGFPFGWGNCYGFVGLFRGVKPREGHPPQNLFLGPLKGEGFWSADPDRAPAEAGFYPSDRPYPKEIGGPWGAIVPEGGLGRLLTGGMERTRQPTFGSVALFRRDDDMGFRHAAIVLGRSKEGTVYVIQKLNQAAPYAISPVNHPLLQDFGSPIYYSR